jgi:hypothetical protein
MNLLEEGRNFLVLQLDLNLKAYGKILIAINILCLKTSQTPLQNKAIGKSL